MTVDITLKEVMMVQKDFKKLQVIGFYEKGPHNLCLWRCKCVCGNELIASTEDLVRGRIKQCDTCPKDNHFHGYHKHPLYMVWSVMKHRCYNANNPAWKDYGGRGIGVCEEWLHDPKAFIEWALSNGYEKGLSIDRINNNKGYSPHNCRWATRDEQSQNMRSTMMTADKVRAIRKDTRVHSVIAAEYGVDESTISRIITGRTWKNIEPRFGILMNK